MSDFRFEHPDGNAAGQMHPWRDPTVRYSPDVESLRPGPPLGSDFTADMFARPITDFPFDADGRVGHWADIRNTRDIFRGPEHTVRAAHAWCAAQGPRIGGEQDASVPTESGFAIMKRGRMAAISQVRDEFGLGLEEAHFLVTKEMEYWDGLSAAIDSLDQKQDASDTDANSGLEESDELDGVPILTPIEGYRECLVLNPRHPARAVWEEYRKHLARTHWVPSKASSKSTATTSSSQPAASAEPKPPYEQDLRKEITPKNLALAALSILRLRRRSS